MGVITFYRNQFLLMALASTNLMAQVNNNVDTSALNNRIDSFLHTLNNKNAKTSLALVLPDESRDSNGRYKLQFDRLVLLLTSINVFQLEKIYPKDLLIKKLVPLLDDPDRDWYANLLLYNITQVYTFNMVSVTNREKWVMPEKGSNLTFKSQDMAMWRRYLWGIVSHPLFASPW